MDKMLSVYIKYGEKADACSIVCDYMSKSF